jgi:hypothetical protein
VLGRALGLSERHRSNLELSVPSTRMARIRFPSQVRASTSVAFDFPNRLRSAVSNPIRPVTYLVFSKHAHGAFQEGSNSSPGGPHADPRRANPARLPVSRGFQRCVRAASNQRALFGRAGAGADALRRRAVDYARSLSPDCRRRRGYRGSAPPRDGCYRAGARPFCAGAGTRPLCHRRAGFRSGCQLPSLESRRPQWRSRCGTDSLDCENGMSASGSAR